MIYVYYISYVEYQRLLHDHWKYKPIENTSFLYKYLFLNGCQNVVGQEISWNFVNLLPISDIVDKQLYEFITSVSFAQYCSFWAGKNTCKYFCEFSTEFQCTMNLVFFWTCVNRNNSIYICYLLVVTRILNSVCLQ